jgi:hypothetical protein
MSFDAVKIPWKCSSILGSNKAEDWPLGALLKEGPDKNFVQSVALLILDQSRCEDSTLRVLLEANIRQFWDLLVERLGSEDIVRVEIRAAIELIVAAQGQLEVNGRFDAETRRGERLLFAWPLIQQ